MRNGFLGSDTSMVILSPSLDSLQFKVTCLDFSTDFIHANREASPTLFLWSYNGVIILDNLVREIV
jgi:hypothetical protein